MQIMIKATGLKQAGRSRKEMLLSMAKHLKQLAEDRSPVMNVLNAHKMIDCDENGNCFTVEFSELTQQKNDLVSELKALHIAMKQAAR